MEQVQERVLNWDDTIQNDGPEFVTLPPGDYPFTVTGFERGRHEPKEGGTGKLPACPKAEVTIRIECDKGITNIKHNLFLHSITEGMLCNFFAGIGQRKKGEPLKMDWNKVIGSTGTCKLKVRKYITKDGNPGEINEIQSFYEKGATTATTQAPQTTNPWGGGF